MNRHDELLAALRANLEDDNGFLVYADFIQERHGEDAAAHIREVVAATSEPIRSADESRKRRATESRQFVIRTGFMRAEGAAKRHAKEAEADRLHAKLAKPGTQNIPRLPPARGGGSPRATAEGDTANAVNVKGVADRMATAHHEAGHAVVATYLRVGVKYVTLTPNGEDHEGVCIGGRIRRDINVIDRDRARRYLEPRIMVYFAGQLAEAKFLGRDAVTIGGHGDDDRQALDCAAFACGSEAESHAFQVWLFERTRNVVGLLWPQIQAVAAALAERGNLHGREVHEVMRSTAGL